MQSPSIPENEAQRKEALDKLEILDTPNEERFDRLTRIAKEVVGSEIALISLVDTNRQWFKSKQGLDAEETPRDISFCGHAILNSDIFYIPNATQDERFADNPLVTGPPNIRSYAGVPINTADGYPIGTLCVIDSSPSNYSPSQLSALKDIAESVEGEINQQQLRDTNQTLKAQEVKLLEDGASLRQAITDESRYSSTLETIHSITTDPNLSFEQRIDALLWLGRETFQLPLALVSQINSPSYIVKYSQADQDPPPPGTEFDLSETYCSHTLMANKPLGFHHTANSEIREHPCYKTFGLESYIGTPLIVNGKRYGTLNFSGPEPRSEPFSTQDYSLIRMIAQWISFELERSFYLKSQLEAKEIAEKNNRAKSEFLNVMSHELRTPLTVILGYLPILKNTDQMPPAEMIASIASDMETSGQHLMAMINDLLDLSKIEADKLQIHPEKVKLKSLCLEVVKQFSEQSRQKGITIAVDSKDIVIVADPIRLKQILLNLISNALKFTDSGRIDVLASPLASGAQISVKDTGQGIATDELPHIFERFYQVDSSSTRKVGGSGLGLAITKKLIELHQGNISVASEEGRGTCFKFDIKNMKEH